MMENKNNGNVNVYNAQTANRFVPDEFSLEEIQQKLGNFSKLEEVNNGALNADVMPTQQTLTMNYQREYPVNAVAKHSKVSTKVKVAAVSYAAIVMILILGITLTSVAVSGVFANTMALTADYQGVVDSIAALDAQISNEDVDALAQRAAELGYIKADQSNSQVYNLVETRPAQNFNIETNWFDSLCDWLCNAFGG